MRSRRERESVPAPGSGPRLSRTPDDAVNEFLKGRRPTVLGPSDTEDPGLAWELHRPTDEEKGRHGDIRGFQRQGGSLAPTNGHRGSAASWVCVAVAVAGFALGGLAVVLDGSVVLLVIGAALMLASLVVAVSTDILSDVVLDPPRRLSGPPPCGGRVRDEERAD
ncbi:hypothetical protein [Nocardiopsis sp. NPDC006938]|uniref:hypothetical protein n=1 Tax=Nocardiopsis sp. NPDC006938 TaxID=3364337 RepID=UPI00369C74AD